MNKFATIAKAIEELKKGKMLVVVDDPGRENQGDIIFPAEVVTEEKINFILQQCRGLICAPLTKSEAIRLDLPLMVAPVNNTEQTRVNFTVTVDAKNVTSFGISAADRAATIKVLVNPRSAPVSLVRPGHIFPLLAAEGGVGARAGHTEATVELARLAGYKPVGVLSEILKSDGEVARLPDLQEFAKRFDLKIISIRDLVEYVKTHHISHKEDKTTLVKEATSHLPTTYGDWKIVVYRSIIDNLEHTALIMGNPGKTPIMTRIHSQCLTGDTFSSQRCDCQAQLHKSMELISDKGEGVILYLNQEGRGIGLTNKIKAYALQDKGLDTVEANEQLDFPADARDYKIAAEILCGLKFHMIDLLTNNPEKTKSLKLSGVTINSVIPIEIEPNQYNRRYLATKRLKMGHMLKNV